MHTLLIFPFLTRPHSLLFLFYSQFHSNMGWDFFCGFGYLLWYLCMALFCFLSLSLSTFSAHTIQILVLFVRNASHMHTHTHTYTFEEIFHRIVLFWFLLFVCICFPTFSSQISYCKLALVYSKHQVEESKKKWINNECCIQKTMDLIPKRTIRYDEESKRKKSSTKIIVQAEMSTSSDYLQFCMYTTRGCYSRIDSANSKICTLTFTYLFSTKEKV